MFPLHWSSGYLWYINLFFLNYNIISGFQNSSENSLEDLCINYANEKLHEQFNQNIFKAEQEEYTSEGISWKDIQYRDNAGKFFRIL